MTRLSSAYEGTLYAAVVCSEEQLRGLFSDLVLLASSFGLGTQNPDSDLVPVVGLTEEVVLAAACLSKVPDDFCEELTSELEEALARHAPVACIIHLVRANLWTQDHEAWCRLLGMLMRHITDRKQCESVMVVVANQVMDAYPTPKNG